MSVSTPKESKRYIYGVGNTFVKFKFEAIAAYTVMRMFVRFVGFIKSARVVVPI